jgi:hypothetical protein
MSLAIDVHSVERSCRPAVIASQWRPVAVATRVLAARVEATFVIVAREIVGPASIGENQPHHLIFGIVRAARRRLLLALALADQLHDLAIALQSIDAEPAAVVALRIAEDDTQ